MRVCDTCEQSKPDAAFRPKGRGRSKTCQACEEGSGESGNATPEATVTIENPLEVLPGFGFRASIENDRLAVEQDRDDGATDNVVLSRTEAKVLFAQYAEWAGLGGAA